MSRFSPRFIFERDEKGRFVELPAALPEWTPPLAPMDPYRTDPEAYLLRVEEMEHVKKLPEIIGGCGKTWLLYTRGLLRFSFPARMLPQA